MLDSVNFELSNTSHVMNIGQETSQHLSRDVMFVVSDKMAQMKYFFVEKWKRLLVL